MSSSTTTSTTTTTAPKHIHYFHITGFGKFANINNNPAKSTVESLHDILAAEAKNGDVKPVLQVPQLEQNTTDYTHYFQSLFSASTTQQPQPHSNTEIHINTNILRVDVETVEEFFALKFEEIKLINQKHYQNPLDLKSTTSSQSTPPPEIHHHFLHVGVHGGAKAVHLEEFAYNNATFRCTDELQFAPMKEPIRWYDGDKDEIQCKVLERCPTTCQPSPWFISPQPSPQHPQSLATTNNLNTDSIVTSTDNDCGVFKPPKDLCYDAVLKTQYDFDTIVPQITALHDILTGSTASKLKMERMSKNGDGKGDNDDKKDKNDEFSLKHLTISPVVITNDPGGFVCNYIYFVSLYYTTFLMPFINYNNGEKGGKGSLLLNNNNNDQNDDKNDDDNHLVSINNPVDYNDYPINNNNPPHIHYSSLFYHIPLPTVSSIMNNINILLATISAIVMTTAAEGEGEEGDGMKNWKKDGKENNNNNVHNNNINQQEINGMGMKTTSITATTTVDDEMTTIIDEIRYINLNMTRITPSAGTPLANSKIGLTTTTIAPSNRLPRKTTMDKVLAHRNNKHNNHNHHHHPHKHNNNKNRQQPIPALQGDDDILLDDIAKDIAAFLPKKA